MWTVWSAHSPLPSQKSAIPSVLALISCRLAVYRCVPFGAGTALAEGALWHRAHGPDGLVALACNAEQKVSPLQGACKANGSPPQTAAAQRSADSRRQQKVGCSSSPQIADCSSPLQTVAHHRPQAAATQRRPLMAAADCGPRTTAATLSLLQTAAAHCRLSECSTSSSPPQAEGVRTLCPLMRQLDACRAWAPCSQQPTAPFLTAWWPLHPR